jgi:hypothetical protein
MALTRPLGEAWFAPSPDSLYAGGPAIQLAQSPDALHWKPLDAPGLRARRGSSTNTRMGGGTPPVLTPQGWLMLYHGVEQRAAIGAYRTFWALLDRDDPARVLRQEDGAPLLEEFPALTDGNRRAPLSARAGRVQHRDRRCRRHLYRRKRRSGPGLPHFADRRVSHLGRHRASNRIHCRWVAGWGSGPLQFSEAEFDANFAFAVAQFCDKARLVRSRGGASSGGYHRFWSKLDAASGLDDGSVDDDGVACAAMAADQTGSPAPSADPAASRTGA